ncbi:MAG: dienelactone hydrolase family protein [Acidimicrobiales bacterium]
MQLESEWVSYDTPEGPTSAYLARPATAGEPLPGILVIQEIWGVDEHIVDVTERLAAAGYAALAPDLFSTGGGRPEVLSFERVEWTKSFLNTIPPDQWMAVLGNDGARAEALAKLPADRGPVVGETLGALFGTAGDTSRHLPVLQAAVSYLRAHPACGGRPVGSVGFCMGGGLSAHLASSDAGLSGAAIFYGGSPSAEEAGHISCPVRGFYGQDDPNVVAGLPAFDEALTKAGIDHDLRVYPSTPHAFFNDTRPSYRPEAARDAWGHLLAFFAEILGRVAAAAP